MHRGVLRIGMALGVLCLIGLARPASATDCTFADARSAILDAVTRGHFKCGIAETLLNLLARAEATSGSERREILRLARACACRLSREIRAATGEPFRTLPDKQDLAPYFHTPEAQSAGRNICDLLTCLLTAAGG